MCFAIATAMRGYWARDDPAVLLIAMAYLAGVCMYMCAWFHTDFWGYLSRGIRSIPPSEDLAWGETPVPTPPACMKP